MPTRTRPDVRRNRSQRRFRAAAVAGSTLIVAAGSVAQVVDYAFFGLRIGVLDSSEDGGAFGAVGDAAAVAAAVAAWWFMARVPSKGAAVVALPPLLTFIALDKVFRLHDLIPHYLAFYAPVLVGTFVCLVVLIRRMPLSCARLLATGVVLLAGSFALHLIGERVLLELGLADAAWAAQLKAVVKHGCEVEGWFLVLISLALGAHQGRRRTAARLRRPPRGARPDLRG
jgi:hypothetical protein